MILVFPDPGAPYLRAIKGSQSQKNQAYLQANILDGTGSLGLNTMIYSQGNREHRQSTDF